MDASELLANLPIGVIAVSADLRVVSMNGRAIALLKPRATSGPIRDALPPELCESVERQLATPGGRMRSVEVQGLMMVLSPLPSGGVAVAVMLSGIPSHLGHEMKTPLTSIKAYTEATEGIVEEEQAKQFLGIILEETDRLIGMIDEQVRRWRE